jgi:hypothetical protein
LGKLKTKNRIAGHVWFVDRTRTYVPAYVLDSDLGRPGPARRRHGHLPARPGPVASRSPARGTRSNELAGSQRRKSSGPARPGQSCDGTWRTRTHGRGETTRCSHRAFQFRATHCRTRRLITRSIYPSIHRHSATSPPSTAKFPASTRSMHAQLTRAVGDDNRTGTRIAW